MVRDNIKYTYSSEFRTRDLVSIRAYFKLEENIKESQQLLAILIKTLKT